MALEALIASVSIGIKKNAHPSHLKDDIAEPIIGEITAVKEGEVESVVGLPWHGQAHVQPLLDLAHLDIQYLTWIFQPNITCKLKSK